MMAITIMEQILDAIIMNFFSSYATINDTEDNDAVLNI
jgi:hypothetical protein